MGDSVPGRKVLAGRAHAVAVDAAPAGPDEERAGLADNPLAEGARLDDQAAATMQPPVLVADEVAEQQQGPALRRRLERPPSRRRAPTRPSFAT